MSVNTNIWVTDKNIGNFDISKTLEYLISNKLLTLNTMYDNTLSMWARDNIIGSTYACSIADGFKIVANFKSNGAITIGYKEVSARDYGSNYPISLLNVYASSTGFKDSDVFAWSPGQSVRSSGYTKPYTVSAVTKFPYIGICLLIQIIAARTEDVDSEYNTFVFDSYFNGTNNVNYPYIRSVYGQTYISYNGTTNRSSNNNIMISSPGTYDIFLPKNDDFNGFTQQYITMPLVAPNSYDIPIIGTFSEFRALQWVNAMPDIVNGYPQNLTTFGNMIYYPDKAISKKMDMTNPEAETRKAVFNYNLTKNDILSYALKWGFIIATNTTAASDITCTSTGTYIPIINNNGYVTSDYTQDGNNVNNPQIKWTNPASESGYNPNDPNKYTDKIDLNKPSLTTTGIFNRTFALNASNVNSLANYLWNADETIFEEIVKGLSLMGGNPIDGLIDLRLYPFDVISKTSGGNASTIVVGRTDTGVSGVKIDNYNAVIDLGSCSFYKKFNNFLDNEPYTTASLYIPYVGIVPVSTAIFAGQNISCKMVVDITTGSCTAIVFCNNIPMIYKNGTIGVEIPMTATNSGQYASRIVGGLTSAATDLTLGATTGNIGQMISGVGNLAESALNTGSTIYNTAGTSSPSCSLWHPQNCYFIIQRPITAIPDNYGHDVGYACNYNATISNLTGYTQTYNVDVSAINAPENEKTLIANILNSGFYA